MPMMRISPSLLLVLALIPVSAHAQFNPVRKFREAIDQTIEKAREKAKEKAKEKEQASKPASEQASEQASEPASEPAVKPVSAHPPNRFQQEKNSRNVTYAGYSKEFLEIKALLAQGKLAEVADHYEQADAKVRESTRTQNAYLRKTGFLTFVERGTLDLVRGDPESSIEDYDGAETVLERWNEQSKVVAGGRKFIGKVKGMVTGRDENVPYYGVGFERVLMLNGKTIAYVLSGDRKAYNVTRRAIDWQNTEKRKFDEERREAEAELKKRGGKKGRSLVSAVVDSITDAYSGTEAKASTVPSAFVNPFGFYMSGMIQEFESAADPSLVSNARISYEKALELNPRSPVLKQAVADMKNGGKRRGKHLVHVVAFDGFTPEKKLLQYQMALPNMILPVKLPIYEPVPSKVDLIRVLTASGARISDLSLVADIDAISLRHQSDEKPKQALNMLVDLGQTFGERTLFEQVPRGEALAKWRERMRTPDMRSWMSLPCSIYAARFLAPKSVKEIKIRSYDRKRRWLSTRSVELSKDGPTFIFIRSIDTQMYAYANQGLWFN